MRVKFFLKKLRHSFLNFIKKISSKLNLKRSAIFHLDTVFNYIFKCLNLLPLFQLQYLARETIFCFGFCLFNYTRKSNERYICGNA